MTTDTNKEKEQNAYSQKEANKSFAYSILMNLSTMCTFKFGDVYFASFPGQNQNDCHFFHVLQGAIIQNRLIQFWNIMEPTK